MRFFLLILTFIFVVSSSFSNLKTRMTGPLFLAPESPILNKISPPNLWELLSQKHNLYAPGELQKRIRSIKKMVPYVLEQLKSLGMNPEEVAAIYATGDYILSPSMGKGNITSPPQQLDFIVFLNNSKTKKKLQDITGLEIEPNHIFSKDEIGYDSAYTVNIRICHAGNKTNVAQAEAYYLACLIHGDFHWKKPPESQLLIRLIRNLFNDIAQSGSNTLVMFKKMTQIMVLMKETLTPSMITRITDRDLGITAELSAFIEQIYPDMHFRSEETVEMSI